MKGNTARNIWDYNELTRNLLTDPHKTLQENFGVKVPENVNFKVVQGSDNICYLVLPGPMAGFTEEQLDVTGGLNYLLW